MSGRCCRTLANLRAARCSTVCAGAAGPKCVLATGFGLGLEIAAKAHLFAATEIVTDAVEFTELSLHANLLKPPWDARLVLPLDDGCLPVPNGPGLGGEVDDGQGTLHAA